MLAEYYNIKTEFSSLVYTVSAIGFLVATPFIYIVRTRELIKRRLMISIGLVMVGIAMSIRTGELLGKHNLWMVYFGQALNGFGLSILMVCSFPEMVDCVEKRDDIHLYTRDRLQIYLSSFSVFIQNVGYALGALTSSAIADKLSFSLAFLIGGVVMILFAVVYLVVCGPGDAVLGTQTVK